MYVLGRREGRGGEEGRREKGSRMEGEGKEERIGKGG